MQLRPCHWGVTSDLQCNMQQKKANSLVRTEHLPQTSASCRVGNLMNRPARSPVITIALQRFLRRPRLKVLRIVRFIILKCWAFTAFVWSSLVLQVDAACEKHQPTCLLHANALCASWFCASFYWWTCTHLEYQLEGNPTVNAWRENLCFPISPFVTVIFISAYVVIWDPWIKPFFP